MTHSFRDTLGRILHDEMLLKYLATLGYEPSMAGEFDGKANSKRASAMDSEILAISESGKRSEIINELQDLEKFDKPAAEDKLLEAIAIANPDESEEYPREPGKTALQRAVWLKLYSPGLYQRLAMKLDMEKQYRFCQRFRYDGCPRMRTDDASRDAFRASLQEFYSRKLKFPVFLKVDRWEEAPGVHCVVAKVQDIPRTLQVFTDDELRTIMFSPVRPVSIQYSEATGCADMLIGGGEQFVSMLKEAFGRVFLGTEDKPEGVRNPFVHSEKLKDEDFHSPLAEDDGFGICQEHSVVIVSSDGELRAAFDVISRGSKSSVTDYYPSVKAPTDTVFGMYSDWSVHAAEFRFLYTNPGKFRGKYKRLSVTLRENGSTNLYRYPAAIRERLVSYLVDGGIMEDSRA